MSSSRERDSVWEVVDVNVNVTVVVNGKQVVLLPRRTLQAPFRCAYGHSGEQEEEKLYQAGREQIRRDKDARPCSHDQKARYVVIAITRCARKVESRRQGVPGLSPIRKIRGCPAQARPLRTLCTPRAPRGPGHSGRLC